MRALDDFLIDRFFQPLVDRIAPQGDAPSLAQHLLHANFASFLASLLIDVVVSGRIASISLVFGSFLLSWLFAVMVVPKTRRALQGGGLNPNRAFWVFRSVMLMGLAFSLGAGLAEESGRGAVAPSLQWLGLLLVVSGIYVLACQNPPPRLPKAKLAPSFG